MAVDTRWDTEQYRTKFESEEHWALKREFIEAHKERIPEERLICLAQVFVNIQLLRCKYPDEVMKQVAVLAKEVGHDYKANQKKRLQRTFVKASDAASAKVKGLKRKFSEVTLSSLKDKPCENESSETFVTSSSSNEVQNKYFTALRSDLWKEPRSLSNTISPRMRSIQDKAKKFGPNAQITQSNLRLGTVNPNDPFVNILLIRYMYANFPRFYSFLCSSLQFSNFGLSENFENNSLYISCFLSAKGRLGVNLYLGSGNGQTQKEAKEDAAKNALEMMLKKCFTLKVLKRSSSVGEISFEGTNSESSMNEEDSNKLGDDNVGAKLLKLMGWSGGALGKSGQGITEPVNPSSVIGRQGLGLKNENSITAEFKANVRRIIQEFKNSEGMSDLVFAPDLSIDQRKHIHLTAGQFGRGKLKTTSYGKGSNRYLVVSHKFSSCQLVQMVLAQGGSTDKYELCKPGTLTIENLSENLTT